MSKVHIKFINVRLADSHRNVVFFRYPIQVFLPSCRCFDSCRWYICRAFIMTVTTRDVALDLSKSYDRVQHNGFDHSFTSLLRFLASFLHLSVISSFKFLSEESIKSSLSTWWLSKPQFLAQPLSCYKLMIFRMLWLILVSMLMILLSSLIVVTHLICASSLSCHIKMLACERKWLVFLNAEKNSVLFFLGTSGALLVKTVGSPLTKKIIFKDSLLNWIWVLMS